MLAAVIAGSGACAGGSPGTMPGNDRVLVADPPGIKIRPGETGLARFVLTSGGVPIAAQTVNFAIVDDPDGATLSASTTVTDVSGVAAVQVHAGLQTGFNVLATAGSNEARLFVTVAPDAGSVMVAPFFASTSNAAARTTRIEVLMFDDLSCADLVPTDPLRPIRDPMQLPASGGIVTYDYVSTTKPHAVIGRALDSHGVPIAVGCVDVSGSFLIVDGVVQVALPLRDAVPNPVGSFTISSPLVFVPPLAAAAAIAGPWRDLGDCPLDPAQLLLDCMIDALSPATAADPLDCQPVAGGEGPLGDDLSARRGKLIVDFGLAVTTCRGASDSAGAPSLDAIAMGLFGSPTPALLVALPAIGEDAAHLLDRIDLSSKLDVLSAGRPDEYTATHTLVGAGFRSSAVGGMGTVALASLALPALTAYVTAATQDGLLVLDNHGFSLRLGRVARAGFGAAALTPRGVSPPDAGGLIVALTDLARSDDDPMPGCAAFDRALCPVVGSAPGCLASACPAGLFALAARLDAVFDAADGTGLDFYLAGSAPLVDTRGDGVAHQLGAVESDPTAIATWSVDLRTAAGRARITVPFTGVRN